MQINKCLITHIERIIVDDNSMVKNELTTIPRRALFQPRISRLVPPVDSRFSVSESPPVCSMDTSVSVHLPCFAWYTVEVIRSLDIGILIYVTIDRPRSTVATATATAIATPIPFPTRTVHDLPARISHTELPSGSSLKVGVQTISNVYLYALYFNFENQ